MDGNVANVPPSSAAAAGVLVIRAWIEPPDGLRVRITSTFDVDTGESTTRSSTSVDEVCDDVRRWLNEYRHRHLATGRDPWEP